MAAWRKQQDDAARHRQVKREAEETRDNGSVQRNVGPRKRHRLDRLVGYPKRPNSGSRRTETPPVPRHVDAPSSCSAPFTFLLLFELFVVCVQQYVGEIKNDYFLRTRPEIFLSERPCRSGSATVQTKALIHTIT